MSHDNLEAVEEAGYHFLTGLKAPQIESILLSAVRAWIGTLVTTHLC
ncbi:MAG: hypothetical protein ABI041_09415 [Bdellovibrionia bacterium]